MLHIIVRISKHKRVSSHKPNYQRVAQIKWHHFTWLQRYWNAIF